MKIACLGWGSLIWKPGILPVREGWRHDGPDLPIDFVRVGDGGELDAVISPGARLSRVLWTVVETQSLAAAREFLRLREKIPSSQPKCVGSIPSYGRHYPYEQEIARWARSIGVEGVVWTALPARFKEINGRWPTVEEALIHLRNLPEDVQRHAELYVRSAPQVVRTNIRSALEEEFGWYPNEIAARVMSIRQGAPLPGSSRRVYRSRTAS